jgi:acetyl esterase/lipase
MTWHRSRIVTIAIIAIVAGSIANCGRLVLAVANVPAYFGPFEQHNNFQYGRDARHSLDVYKPSGAAHRPVVIFLHGGTWVKGEKEHYRFVGAALAQAGYVAVLPNYRLYPQVRFPEFIQDGARAVLWVREHVSEFGGDPSALFLMGHSAGAHIAASLALDSRYLREIGGDTSWVRGWIALSGPHALELRTPLLRDIFREPYTAADWQPLALVSAHAPAALILHGTDDMKVHPREAVQLQQKLVTAGIPVECHIYEYGTHMDTLAALSVPMRNEAPVLADVTQFIERTVAGTALSTPCPVLRLRRDWFPGEPTVFNGR